MAEYIEREALLADEHWNALKDDFDRARARVIVATFPAADVVEVVRCKDCSYGETDSEVDSWYLCRHQGCDWNYGNHFCSYGERREEK